MKNSIYMPALLVLILLNGCSPNPSPDLQIGKWRGVFGYLGTEIPFNFSVEDDTAGNVKVLLTNADERFQLDSVRYERDSVIIPIDVYDALLIAKVNKDSLHGYFRKNQSAKQGIPFKAARNQTFRFGKEENNSTSQIKSSGTWSVFINGEKGQRYTVGKFHQTGTKVTGTFLTITGDYRYFEGTVEGDSLKVSAFSGSNPTLFKARFSDSLHLEGVYLSFSGKSKVMAIKNDTAKLPDPYKLTYLKKGFDKLEFSFPDLSGKTVSLTDLKFRGKVVIVTIQGSWCPNCLDEAAFLSPWYKQNKERGVEIIGLSFERKDDLAFARQRIEKFIKRFDIQYYVLFAGLSDKAEASKKLPALNAVLAFPTTIILDRSGKVWKIHTGFSGPATGAPYEEFIQEFKADVDAALSKTKI